MKYIIVNADEFGLDDRINEAILESYKSGIVTSTTIMVNMPAFDQAINIAKENPELGVGIHLNLTTGRPTSNAHKILSLIYGNQDLLNRREFEMKLLLGKIDLLEVEEELRSQILKFKETGIELTHLDGHQNIQSYPSILSVMIKLAKENYIPLRKSNERFIYGKEWRWGLPLFKKIYIRKIFKQLLNARNRKLLDSSGVLTTDDFLSIFSILPFPDKITIDTYKFLLSHIREGVTELMCHPGHGYSILRKSPNDINSEDQELEILTHSHIKQLLRELDIHLISFKHLKELKA